MNADRINLERARFADIESVTFHALATDAGELVVVDTGGNLPVCLMWPSLFSDSKSFLPLVRRLRDSWRCVVIDGPAHGLSGPPASQNFSMQTCGLACRQILDDLALDTAVCIGTGLGGVVATHMALQYPERTNGLVAMNAPFGRGRATARALSLVAAIAIAGRAAFARKTILTRYFGNGLPRSAEDLANIEHHLARNDSRGLARVARAFLLEREELLSQLVRITAPALVIAGARNEGVTSFMQRDAALRLSDNRFEIVDAGHLPLADAPETTIDLIESFLEEKIDVPGA